MDRDLIDRNELIKKLDPEYKETVKLIKSGETHLDSLAEGYHEVYDLIVWEPTVEAKPVIHGHWIRGNYIDIKDSSSYKCSECGEEFDKEIFELYTDTINYCPACGAKMDKEK